MAFNRVANSCLLLTLAASRLVAQPAGAQLVLGGGTATDLRGVRSGAWSAAPSLNLQPSPAFSLGFGGRATRFTEGEWSLGGSGGARLRLPVAAGFGLSLAASAEAIRTSYGVTYLSAEGLPALEWRRGAVSLWGGAHGATAKTALDQGGLPLAQGTLTRSSMGPAFGAGLRFASLLRQRVVELSYRDEHSRPAGVALADRSVGVGLTQGRLAISGRLGYRDAADERRWFGGGGIGVHLAQGVALVASAESYPANRLTGTVGGRSFSAGVALSVGGPRRLSGPPLPRGVPAAAQGLTRLSLAAPEAQRVEVAGDWNAWRYVGLARAANGVWYVDLAIPRGVYRYAFRIDGTRWEVPKGVAAVNDGFGGRSAWLTISGPAETAAQSANRKEAP